MSQGLRDYWLGQAGNSMDDLYDMERQHGFQEEEGRGVRNRLRAAVLGVSCTEKARKTASAKAA